MRAPLAPAPGGDVSDADVLNERKVGIDLGMNCNVPSPSSAALMGFQGQWNASAGAPRPFGNQLGSLSMQNLLGTNAGPGVGMGGGINMAGGMNINPIMGAGVGMADPRLFMAHQQAMMIVKQDVVPGYYQLAVAYATWRTS